MIMNDKDQRWALFWCSLLQPVIFDDIDRRDINRFLRELSEKEVLFPNGETRRPSISTLRRKLRAYRKDGFEALARKRRCDRGKPRLHTEKVISDAIDIKRDLPTRSHIKINQLLSGLHKTTVPKSTLYRYLKHAGATRVKLGVDKKKVRRRWTRDRTNALWLGDFEDGPYVLVDGQVVPTHLSAFIDCHSRFILEARYYYRQNLDILIDSFLRALENHGSPLELYVDQAKVYLSHALRCVCFQLNIRHIRRGKGDPPPGGLIEKYFWTCQSQFEAEVREGDIMTLEQLNRAFSAWLEMSYHREVNTETGQSPRERYEQGLTVIRHVDLEQVAMYFMRRVVRTVHPDFSDIQLHRRFYRVDKRLRKDKVEVRYDPFSSIETVLVYSRDGEFLGKGTLHSREKGEDPSPPQGRRRLKYNYLEFLIQKHEKELQAQTRGIDFRRAVTARRWAFASFAKALSQLLGRTGGITTFSSRELELLKKTYNRMPELTKPLCVEAVENAAEKTLLAVLYHLQRVYHRKE
jgi:transposase InsO family protein